MFKGVGQFLGDIWDGSLEAYSNKLDADVARYNAQTAAQVSIAQSQAAAQSAAISADQWQKIIFAGAVLAGLAIWRGVN